MNVKFALTLNFENLIEFAMNLSIMINVMQFS